MSKPLHLFLSSAAFFLIMTNYADASSGTTTAPPATTATATATAPAPLSKEMQLMLQAAAKVTDVLMAQLDGNAEKTKNAATEAIELYNQVLAENPENVKAINARAAVQDIVANGQGTADYNKAIEISTASLSKNPNDADAYYNRATAYRGLKSYDKARADYEQAIKLNPQRTDWQTALKAMNVEAK